jgi:hypothetical protein
MARDDKRLQEFMDGLEDIEKWNRAKVEACIEAAVVMARRLELSEPLVKEMLARWPDDSSVRYEWFRNLAMRPEIEIPYTECPNLVSLENVYRVLARWFHLIDSNMERTALILHACGLSFDKIAEMFKSMRWNRKTLSRRYSERLDKLVYDLNHIDGLKWPVGVRFADFK